jgi:hypothetical protein
MAVNELNQFANVFPHLKMMFKLDNHKKITPEEWPDIAIGAGQHMFRYLESTSLKSVFSYQSSTDWHIAHSGQIITLPYLPNQALPSPIIINQSDIRNDIFTIWCELLGYVLTMCDKAALLVDPIPPQDENQQILPIPTITLDDWERCILAIFSLIQLRIAKQYGLQHPSLQWTKRKTALVHTIEMRSSGSDNPSTAPVALIDAGLLI